MVILSRRLFAFVAAAFSVGLLLLAHYTGLQYGKRSVETRTAVSERVFIISATHRKLLHPSMEPNRIWGEKCSKSDIVVNQGPTDPLPSGIPTYTVEVMNVCMNGCDISEIHLSCGWFSSARLINPRIFKRLRYDDCLVNDGNTLVNGGSVSFQYANTFSYPLSVSSVIC